MAYLVLNWNMGTKYGFRIHGVDGSLSNPNKLMLDPYAKAVVGKPDLSCAENRAWFYLKMREIMHI